MPFEPFSEIGFDRLRFGGRKHTAADSRLRDILPILIHLEDKSTLTAERIPATTLQRIVDIAAGGTVTVSWENQGSALGTVSLRERTMSLSNKRPCGLRDLIFLACLMRTYATLPDPAQVPLREQFAETWDHLVEVLPQCLEYCSTANEMEAEFGYSPGAVAGTGKARTEGRDRSAGKSNKTAR